MPGWKRKLDEDTWLVLQSKKLKSSQFITNVYEATLAKLRLGARLSFAAGSLDQIPGSPTTVALGEMNLDESAAGPSHSNPVSVTTTTPSITPQIRIEPDVICPTCLGNRQRRTFQGIQLSPEEFNRCGYCEKMACHVDQCKGCFNRFCINCCIQKYDDPCSETFVCISCLN